MISNSTLKEIGKTLLQAGSVMLFPHENPDGDAIGSCVALCKALRDNGVDTWILTDGDLPEYISFIDDGFCTSDPDVIPDPDICAYIDCRGESRINGREEAFRRGRKHICIDHHLADSCSEDMYYIDEDEAATAQIIYKLIKYMELPFDRLMADAIYAGICSDTGSFRYSNTTDETHRIAAELFDIGIDHNDIMVQLHQNNDMRQIRIEAAALAEMELFASGKGAIACVSQKMMQECGADYEHTEHLIDVLRDIKGVEIAAALKEKAPGVIKVSLRAKTNGDVNAVAVKFGGGGHIKAAGCTIDGDLMAAKAQVMEAIEEAIKALEGKL